MSCLQKFQKEIYKNKENRNFNVTDVGKEIILMTEELGELARAYKNSDKKSATDISNKAALIDSIGDLLVYCLGLCEMLGVDSENILSEIIKNNTKRTHTGNF